MSRITPPDEARLPSSVREIFDDETRRHGATLNTTRVWARHPALLAAYRGWGKAFGDAATLIPPVLRYLVYVRVASLNGCPF